jgi:hypothetical protein
MHTRAASGLGNPDILSVEYIHTYVNSLLWIFFTFFKNFPKILYGSERVHLERTGGGPGDIRAYRPHEDKPGRD